MFDSSLIWASRLKQRSIWFATYCIELPLLFVLSHSLNRSLAHSTLAVSPFALRLFLPPPPFCRPRVTPWNSPKRETSGSRTRKSSAFINAAGRPADRVTRIRKSGRNPFKVYEVCAVAMISKVSAHRVPFIVSYTSTTSAPSLSSLSSVQLPQLSARCDLRTVETFAISRHEERISLSLSLSPVPVWDFLSHARRYFQFATRKTRPTDFRSNFRRREV